MRNSVPYTLFLIVTYLALSGLILLCTLPFLHIIAVAFSSNGPASANSVSLWPVGFTFEAFANTFSDKMIIRTFMNSLLLLVVGVVVHMVFVMLVAYPLSKEPSRFPLRNVYVWVIMFTMFFHGGLIPMYLLIRQLKLNDTIWALILPGAVPVFYCIILLNFFRQLPKEIEESAFMDGASPFRSLISIYLPLSVPALATITLFSMIHYWNSWFDALIYMRDPQNYPYTTYLRILITRLDKVQSLEDVEKMMKLGQRPMIMSYVLISILPIMCVYPFLQKYVKSGLVLGSVKG
jgi:putative aldouronate transport system permease protein